MGNPHEKRWHSHTALQPVMARAAVIFLLALLPALGVTQQLRAQDDATTRADAAADAFLQRISPASTARTAARTTGSFKAGDPTPIILDAVRNWDSMSAAARDRLSAHLQLGEWRNGARQAQSFETGACSETVPKSTAQLRESTHFRVYYTTTGSHAATSEYIDKVIAAAETSWQTEVVAMGYKAPRLNNNKIDLYVCDLLDIYGALGVTWSETVYTDRTLLAHIELDNDYEGYEFPNGVSPDQMLQVTMAHEFFHAIQFGINYPSCSLWLMEATATWMEDEVYPDVNDYVGEYIEERFNNLETSIDVFGSMDLMAYGSSIFFRHITENITDISFVKDVWDELASVCVTTGSATWCDSARTETPLIDTILGRRGTNIRDVYQSFNEANVLKKYRDGSLSYFPSVPTTNFVNSYSSALNHLAAKIIKLPGTGTGGYCDTAHPDMPKIVTLNFSLVNTATWRVSLIKYMRDGTTPVVDVDVNGGVGSFTDNMFCGEYTSVVIIIDNVTLDVNSSSYVLTGSVTDRALTTYTHTFPAGWNLVGMPFSPALNAPARAIGAESAILWQLKAAGFFTGTDLDNAAAGAGWFINFDAEKSISVYGSAPTSGSVQLHTGWNIISTPYNSQKNWDETLTATTGAGTFALGSEGANACLAPTLYAFNASTNSFDAGKGITDGAKIEPWTGYAVKALQSCSINFPSD